MDRAHAALDEVLVRLERIRHRGHLAAEFVDELDARRRVVEQVERLREFVGNFGRAGAAALGIE
jgi:hypothetical protein